MPPRTRDRPRSPRPVRTCTRTDLTPSQRIAESIALGDGERETRLQELARETKREKSAANRVINERIAQRTRTLEKRARAKKERRAARAGAPAGGPVLLAPHRVGIPPRRHLSASPPHASVSPPPAKLLRLRRPGAPAPAPKGGTAALKGSKRTTAPQQAPEVVITDEHGDQYQFPWARYTPIGRGDRLHYFTSTYPELARRRTRRVSSFTRLLSAFQTRWRGGASVPITEVLEKRSVLFNEWEHQPVEWRQNRLATDSECYKEWRTAPAAPHTHASWHYNLPEGEEGYESDGVYLPQAKRADGGKDQ